KVSVAWTDVPGTPGAGTELVNDLDLTVTAADGTMYLGNNFADGASAPGGTPDSKNNLENVYISNPAVGVYTVTVTGVNVPSGPQDYALVVSYGGGPTPVGNVFWNQGTFMSSALAGLVLMDSDLSGTATGAVTSDAGHLRHQHVERNAQFGADRLADQRGGHELDPVRDHDAAKRDRRRRVRPDPRAHAEGPHAEHYVLLRSHRDGPGREHGGGQQRWSVLHLHDAPDPARPPAR